MYKSIFLLLFLLSAQISYSQDDNVPMRVIHATAVPQDVAVQNIFVDENNTKWVANSKGIYRINSVDNATLTTANSGEWSLLRQYGGNSDLVIQKYELEKLSAAQSFDKAMGDGKITTTYFDAKRKHLWIGTDDSGLYKYKIGKEVKLLKRFNTSNSDLKSNHINSVVVDKYKRIWVGTDKGVLFGSDDRWKLYEDDSKILSVLPLGLDVWILGDEILWKVDENGRWFPGNIDPKLSKGTIKNMAFDSDAKLWVASESVTRYDVVENKVERFDRSNGFMAKHINCIKLDKDNALWVGTDQGLYLIDKESSMTVSLMVSKPLSCAGFKDDAVLQVNIMGGVPPYAYKWDNEYVGANPSNVGPGYYKVMVTDSLGQKREVSAEIIDNRLKVSVDKEGRESRPNALDGTAQLNVEGGEKPYKIVWDNGEKKEKAKRLSAGQHQVTISDAAGCSTTMTVNIAGQAVASASTKLNILVEQGNALNCAGNKTASIDVITQGGNPPYKYKWSHGLSGKNPTGIGSGTYSVTVTDASNKTVLGSVTIEEPKALSAFAVQTSPASRRKRNGVASVTVYGGTPSYKYLWDNGATTKEAKKLTKGKHTVTVTDMNGCIAVANVNLSKKEVAVLALNSGKLRKGQIYRLDKLYFPADSTDMTIESLSSMDELLSFLQKNSKVKIEVGGHTNNIPKDEYCDRLSTARAKSVARYLISKGIEGDRVFFKGYGKRKPIASNNTSGGRAKNQRVEIKILETGT